MTAYVGMILEGKSEDRRLNRSRYSRNDGREQMLWPSETELKNASGERHALVVFLIFVACNLP